MSAHDYTTRVGRVQVAWWLEAQGIDAIIVTIAERSAYETAHDGGAMDDEQVAALKRAVERMAGE